MRFKPLEGNVVKSIHLLQASGKEDVMPILKNHLFQDAYDEMALYLEDGDELYIHVRSRANASLDDEGAKTFF